MKAKKKKGKFYYDAKAAKHAVDFIERYCTHVKGEQSGEPIKLEKWQKEDIINPIFGWKRADGTRRYRHVWIELPRKNAKTTIVTAIELYLFFCDQEPGAEIYFAAAARQQANIGFEIAADMIKQHPALAKRTEIYKNSIVLRDTSTKLQALSAEAYSKHGFNAHGILIDEIHAQPNSELIDVLTTSTGARRQPLVVYITTAGIRKKGHVAWELHRKAQDIKKGKVKDDEFLAVIYQAGSNDDPFAEKTWKKANPNYGVSVKKEYLQAAAERAQREPTFYNTFLRLHLNVWTSSEQVFIADGVWNKCNLEPLSEEFFYGKDCVVTFDLSATTDFTAVCIGTRDEKGVSHLKVYTYIPELKAQSRNIREQIDVWAKEGWITKVPGKSIDYDFVYQKINELRDKCNIIEVAYDRWNKNEVAKRLENDGAKLCDFGQGYKTMSPATKQFEKRVGEKKINHGGNPVMDWMISNVAIEQDAAGNIKPNKQKSTEKIDGIITMIMADARLLEAPADNGESVYDSRGILEI